MYKVLDDLFAELKAVLGTDEFACHKMTDKIIVPVYKNDTDDIGLEAWKKFHSTSPVEIEKDALLKEMKETRKSIYVNNLDKDSRNATCFKAFNIKAIYAIPIIDKDEAVAIIVMPVLNSYYDYTEEKRALCEKIVKKYNDLIINSGLLS